ncbi:hypothetical protein NAL32_21500 [Chryseobacterium sp. Ch-15]|uniref:Uncharacterized protein n=1 Tax=Chryseobacterium muglaense TaxID=2893752 RepID=A0A9Q3YSX0_9FLAO|nr:hypothetical protein [Chryseobacterium muglaense]MBD3907305.1 hypothetical protein [Chryseobacterium muglaense]MCC9036516.1 hypothetical protein [Chryseobacterium muglaense]MCM2556968.1 hypothetical protein [Chryseobacterium muglaense]
MKNKILIILLILFINCKNKGQNYNYELEDSDESYVMDSWSNEQKEDYYNRVGNLVKDFLSQENYNIPNEKEFNKSLSDKLGIKPNSNKTYQIIPHHIFEKDSLDGYAPQLIIFPNHQIVSFKSELPLLNKSSLKYYNSSDFKDLDRSKEFNAVINKLLFSPNDKEIDIWLKDEQLNKLFTYLVCSFHFEDKKIFQHVIKKLSEESDTKKNNLEYLQLLFKRDRKVINNHFLKEIASQDIENKMYVHFKNVINSEIFNVNEQKGFLKEIDEIYKQSKTTSKDADIKSYLKKNYQIIDEINADIDGDLDDDRIYIASSSDEITNAQVLILKNNNNSFSLWARNDSSPFLGQKEYKKTVTKGKYFTIEYNRDIEDKYNEYNYLTFKFQDNGFLLHQYSKEIYDVNQDKNLPVKIWTNKNFGNVTFEKISYDFIENLD